MPADRPKAVSILKGGWKSDISFSFYLFFFVLVLVVVHFYHLQAV